MKIKNMTERDLTVHVKGEKDTESKAFVFPAKAETEVAVKDWAAIKAMTFGAALNKAHQLLPVRPEAKDEGEGEGDGDKK